VAEVLQDRVGCANETTGQVEVAVHGVQLCEWMQDVRHCDRTTCNLIANLIALLNGYLDHCRSEGRGRGAPAENLKELRCISRALRIFGRPHPVLGRVECESQNPLDS